MSTGLRSPSLKSRTLRAVLVFALLAGMLIAAALFYMRQQTLAEGERFVLSLSQLVAEQTARSLQSVEQALELTRERLSQAEAAGALDEAVARRLLRQQLASLPYVRAMWLLDASGRIEYDSDYGNVGISLADRPYFQVHLQSRVDYHVGNPVRSRSLGTWLVSVSHPWRDRAGRLRGVLVAAIEPPYFDRLWRHVAVGANGSISLYTRHGTLVMRSPFVDEWIGRNYASSLSLLRRVQDNDHGSFTGRSPLDQRERVVSFRVLSNHPELVVVAGVEKDLLLQPWHRMAVTAAVIWLLFSSAGTLLAVMWAREVEERRRIERGAEEARRMESIGTLAGGIAHDFNNVLAAMLGHLNLALRYIDADHPAATHLDLVGESGERARLLVRQILSFSRGTKQDLQRVRLQDVVDETLRMMRATLPGSVQVLERAREPSAVVQGDGTQIQQIVLNLCTNAWQAFVGARGTIEVSVEVITPEEARRRAPGITWAGPVALLVVSDDGPGIPKNLQDKVFEPFFTTKPKGMGTGLGLALVRRIVLEHGGDVRIASEVGAGCRVHVLLPLAPAQEDDPANPAATPERVDALAGTGERILCVDDDDVVLLMLEGVLSNAGYQVVVCRSGAEALDLLRTDEAGFPVLVTDFDMPEQSGIDLARRALSIAPHTIVVLQSGYLTDEIVEEAAQSGVHKVLHKETAWRQLPRTIAELLTRTAREKP